MQRLWQDLRFAARTLGRTPSLTATAVATLALGIGANTVVFSLVNTVLLRPLPFAEPARLYFLFERARGTEHGDVSAHEFVAWRRDTRGFDGMAMFTYGGATLTGRGEALTVNERMVTANFFDVLGQRPALGHTFRSGDDSDGAASLVVLSHALWMTRFGGDSAVIGQRALLDDKPYEVIGVMPPRGDMDADLWVAMDLAAEARKVGKHSNVVVGRLAQGATAESADRDLAAAARRLEQTYPNDNKGHGVHMVPVYDEMVGDVRRPFLIALGAVALVLLVACANVAHLLLTRAAARQRELAVRAAVGASRAQLVRQLVTEAFVLSALGATLGFLLAQWVIDLFPKLSSLYIPRLNELHNDGRVLAATAATCVFTCLACGLLPALRASRPILSNWLADGTRGSAALGNRIAGLLVVSELAIALMLLVGSGLTLKSFARLMRVDPGFDAHDVLAVSLPLPGPRYPNAEQQRRAVNDLLDGVSRAPGVRFAGATTVLPLSICCNNMGVTIEGKPAPVSGKEPQVSMTITAGRYFEAMQIPLRRGRFFEGADARVAIPLIRWYPQQPVPPRFDEPQAAPVAVVSEAMARKFWPNEDPIGKRLKVLFSPWITVVGVVADVRQTSLAEPAAPELYLSNLQEPNNGLTLVLRTTTDPSSVAPLVRERVRALDKELPVGGIRTMDDVVWNSVGRPRLAALLLGAAGAIALFLAVIGVYGVLSYAVERRTHEIGIRRALGAQPRDVLRLVLGRAMGLVAAGIGVGIVGALALTRVLTTLLFQVAPNDAVTFVGVAVLLGGVALLASYVPGRRATRVDPTDALRTD
jgi:putative ABC transport system permease protein